MIYKSKQNKFEEQRIKQEASILSMLDHPNILKVYEYYEDEKYFYIVTELCEGGTIQGALDHKIRFTEIETANAMK